MRAAIFDLDGTLADTSADLLAAANACFPQTCLTMAEDRALAFQGGRAMLRVALERQGRAWTEETVAELYPRLLEHYERHIARDTRLFPGVEAALDRLALAGWGLGVCTLKPEGLADLLLRKLGVRDRFATLTGQDSLPYKKPDPRHLLDTIAGAGGVPAHSVLIGDSQTDRDTAANADVACILVTFRPDGLDVGAMNAAGLLDHFDDLPALLDGLIARP
ncbi:HAD hydrolase-like protein [Algicella marina]|uniref:phosphoglycolate phosphatase n=1 Tax=Algicella marina TaxID=2683284 RepID=A0A6P1T1Y4_9RHOB|nr:HAD hydrolase-like protein [Algicella marina]QHQ35299.1 HAD hydrolase-like protein [Algicella marina]